MKNKSCNYSAFLVLFFLVISYSSGNSTTLFVTPDTIEANINDTVEFYISIDQVDSLYSFSFDLSYDSDLLEITEIIESDVICCNPVTPNTTSFLYSIKNDTVVIGNSILDSSSSGVDIATLSSLVIVWLKETPG